MFIEAIASHVMVRKGRVTCFAGAGNAELCGEFFNYIEDVEVREAFAFLVGLSATQEGLSCRPQRKCAVRDFRSGQYDLDVLKAVFDGVNVNETGEWTVRLRSIADVRSLWSLLNLN